MSRRARAMRRQEYRGAYNPLEFRAPYRVVVWVPRYNAYDGIDGYTSHTMHTTFTLGWAAVLMARESADMLGEYDCCVMDRQGNRLYPLPHRQPVQTPFTASDDDSIPF